MAEYIVAVRSLHIQLFFEDYEGDIGALGRMWEAADFIVRFLKEICRQRKRDAASGSETTVGSLVSIAS